MKLTSIKTALAKILAQFERISTDKGLLSFDGDELEVGMDVNVVDEEGNETVAPDGEYATEEGTIYVVSEGKVVEIKEPEVNPEPEAEPAPEEPQETAENAEEVPQSEEEPEAEPEADERDERIANLEAEVARLEEELGAARERIAELEKENEELKNKPAAEPAEEEFERVNTQSKTGNKKLDNLINRFKA